MRVFEAASVTDARPRNTRGGRFEAVDRSRNILKHNSQGAGRRVVRPSDLFTYKRNASRGQPSSARPRGELPAGAGPGPGERTGGGGGAPI